MPTELSGSADLIYIIGAGGHARVVLDALLAAGVAPARLRLSDNDGALRGARMLGVPVEVPAVRAEMAGQLFHVAIGAGAVRARLHAQLTALGARAHTVVHPRAVVSPHAVLGPAVFVAANAVVGPLAVLGAGVIVNHGAVVDHDCQVGPFAHVAPNATLGGAVVLGAQALVGAGANVLPGCQLGAYCVAGAGAAVLQNVPAARTCVGVPAVLLVKESSD